MIANHGWLHEVYAAEPAGKGFLEELESQLAVRYVAVEVAPAGTLGIAYRSQANYLE